MRRVRTIARVALWTLFGGATLVLVAMAGLYAFLHTDTGRNVARTRAERAISNRLNGDLEIGAISGDLFGTFTLHDVVIRDDGGKNVVAVDAITADYSPLEILGREVDAQEIVLRGLTVHATQDAQGTIDLVGLIKRDKSGAKSEPWQVDIDELRIENGTLRLDRVEGEDVALDDVSLAAALHTDAGGGRVELRRFAANWRQRELPLTAEAVVAMYHSTVAVDRLHATAGESELRVPTASFDGETGSASARFELQAAARDLRRVAPSWLASLDLSGTLTAEPGGAIDVDVQGAVADAPVSLRANLLPGRPSIEGELRVDRLRPERVVEGAPAGVVTGTATVDIAGRSIATAEGTVTADVHGRLAGYESPELNIDARVSDGVLRARVRGRSPLGAVSGDVVVDAREPGTVITGDLDVESVSVGDTRVGRAHVEVSLSGVPDAMEGTVAVDASEVAHAGDRFGAVRAELDFSEGGDRIAGVVRAGDRSAPYWVRARIDAVRQGDRLRINADDVSIGTRKLVWTGYARGALLPRDRVRIDMAWLSSSAGAVAATGTVRSDGARGELDLAIGNLDLERVRAAAPAGVGLVAPALGGRVTASASIRLGRLALDANGSVDALVWQSGQPPVSGTFRLTLDNGMLDGSVAASAPGVGRAALAAALRTPARITDAAAWKAFRIDWIDDVVVTMDELHLQRLVALVPNPPRVEGVVSGTVELKEAANRLVIDVRGTQLRARDLNQPIAVDVRAQGDRARIEGTAALGMGTSQVLVAEGNVRLGVRELLERPGAIVSAPIDMTVRFPATSLARIAELGGDVENVRGRVQAKATLRGSIEQPRAQFEGIARNAGIGHLVFSEVTLKGEANPDSWQVRLDGNQQRGGTVALRARGEMSAGGRVEGELRADELQLVFLSAILSELTGAVGGVGGTVDARLAVSGTLSNIEPRGTLRIRDGSARFQKGVRSLEDIGLLVRLEPKRFDIRGRARASSGTVTLAARGRLDGLMPSEFTGEISAQDLPVATDGSNLAVTVDANARGVEKGNVYEMWLELDEATVVLPKKRDDRKRHPTGPLEDVVYVNDFSKPSPRKRPSERVVRLHLLTPKGIRIRGGDEVRLNVDTKLSLTNTATGTSIIGWAEVDRGRVRLFDRRYDVHHATATFTGDSPPNPKLDVRVSHRFREATVHVDVSGTLKEPEIAFASDPGIYSSAELLGFVLGGTPGAEPRDATGSLAAGAASAATSLIAGRLESVVQSRVPVDTVSFGTEDDTGVTDPAVSYVSVGKWITDNLFIAYRRRFDPTPFENANEAEMEYRFFRNWLIEGSLGDAGAGSADVLWIKRFGR